MTVVTVEYGGFNIIGEPTYGHKLIKTVKGRLPAVLDGFWSTTELAKQAIDRYNSSKEPANATSDATV